MANEVRIQVDAETERAKQGVRSLGTSMKAFSQTARVAGIALAAFGAAGIIAFKKFARASIEQENALRTLGVAITIAGGSFAAVRAEILATTAALQKKTNFGDEAQIRALQQLVFLSQNYEASIAALPAVLDLATALNIDLNAAVNLVGRGLAGNVTMFTRYGIAVESSTTPLELVALLTKQFGGAAAANADPITQMSNAAGDLGESMGKALLPTLGPILKALTGLFELLQKIPAPIANFAGGVAVIAVALAAVGGPILLLVSLLPILAAGWTQIGVSMARTAAIMTGTIIPAVVRVTVALWAQVAARVAVLAAMGPLGWAILAGGAAVAAAGVVGLRAATAPTPMAHGGIVTRPTIALLGERGPEAVVPLGAGGGALGGTTVIFKVGAFMGSPADAREFGKMFHKIIREEERMGR